MSVHPQIKCGGSCTHSSPLGKDLVRLYDLTLKDGQGSIHTPLDDTGRRMSVPDAVRADITVERGLQDCRGWSDSNFCNNAKIENIKHFV